MQPIGHAAGMLAMLLVQHCNETAGVMVALCHLCVPNYLKTWRYPLNWK